MTMGARVHSCADGVNGDQLQLSPPLVCTVAQLEEAVGILAESIEEVRGALMTAASAVQQQEVNSAS
jgi:adenosylmethionine-8-amino-7-oxononanoate aminotransferase